MSSFRDARMVKKLMIPLHGPRRKIAEGPNRPEPVFAW